MRIVGFSLWSCIVMPVLAHAADTDALGAKAQAALKTNCFGCHGKDGAAKGGFDYVLDRTKLVSRGKVTPGQPEESEIYQRIRDNEMPPASAKQRPSAEDRALLNLRNAAAAPTSSPTPAHTFATESAVIQPIRDALH